MSKTLIVDGCSISYAAFYAQALSHNGTATQVPFSVLNSIRSYLSGIGGHKIIFLWDNNSAYRSSIYPEYKAGRDDSEEKRQKRREYKEQETVLREGLRTLGIPQVSANGFEADDIAYQMVSKLGVTDPEREIVLITGDRDWLQMMTRPSVSWFEHRNEHSRIVTFHEFAREAKVPTIDAFIQVKAIAGDKSDNIPGVGGIGEKGAIDIITQYGSLDAFLQAAKAPGFKLSKAQQPLIDNTTFTYRGKEYPPPVDTFRRNLLLVDLSVAPEIPSCEFVIVNEQLNQDHFRNFCIGNGFMSFLEDLDRWIEPFITMKR